MNSRFRRERRQPPYYLLTGLILGTLLGALISMVLFPVQYTNVPPETLNLSEKDVYRLVIARAFQANPDLGRAQSRLGLLRETDLVSALQQQASRAESRSDAQALQNLAASLSGPPVPDQNETPTGTAAVPPTSTPTSTPPPRVDTATVEAVVRTATPQPTRANPTSTSIPTATPVNTGSIPFVLVEQREICNTLFNEPLIQVEVFDSDQNPLPNIGITVTWENGQDSFYTGYYPEISAGYADFSMTPGESYTIRVGEIGEFVEDLTAPVCEDDAGIEYWGSIYLRFEEP